MRWHDLPTILHLGVHVALRKIPYFPVVASFDVTDRCTLHCQHCYWWLQERPKELPKETYLEGVREIKMRHPSLLMAIWMGGEPLLRKDLVERRSTRVSSTARLL